MKDENSGRGLDLKVRTRNYALSMVRFYVQLPKTTEAQILGKQVLRSGTSVGAHYHEAQRAKSNADFIHKIEGALQEAEETGYWLDLLNAANIADHRQAEPLLRETEEIIAILVSIVRKVKAQHTSR